MDIEDKTATKIESLCIKAEQMIDADRLADAQKLLFEAYELVPEFKEEWEESTYILVSLGDTFLWQGNFAKALDAYEDALKCPTGDTDPYIAMRRGQCFFETNQKDLAQMALKSALQTAGQELFDGEDPKYLALAKS
jgi:tetratricopeptide (TPR) repeat protein